MMPAAGSALAAAGLLTLFVLAAAAAASPAPYTPRAGDGFHYTETIRVYGGVGNYTGYTDLTSINGSLGVTAVATNGTEAATYQNTQAWHDNQGGSQTASAQGNFTFSATTYRYVQGTDNQTGYVNPYVWFFIDNAQPVGSSFYLLNTGFTVESRNATAPAPTSPTGFAAAISAVAHGAYQRHDAYGVFSANFTWTAYFDPATGYIVSYVYSEQDLDGAGNGFTYIDELHVTQSSYPLTAVAPPPVSGPPQGLSVIGVYLAIALVVLVVVVLAVGLGVRARRRRLPRHGAPLPGSAPWTPPPIQLSGAPGPAPQVVLRETVKVNCRYCGTLIDSTATICPKCGAPRT